MTISLKMLGIVRAIRCQIWIMNLGNRVDTNGVIAVSLPVRCSLGTNQGENWWTCDTRVKK